MDEPAIQSRNNPALVFKPKEFCIGLFVAAAIVLTVAGTRHYVRARTGEALNSCSANLKQLQGAKDTWALRHHKQDGAVPTLTDLIGPKGYITKMPICPQGGTYTLGPVSQPPRCSIPEHVLP